MSGTALPVAEAQATVACAAPRAAPGGRRAAGWYLRRGRVREDPRDGRPSPTPVAKRDACFTEHTASILSGCRSAYRARRCRPPGHREVTMCPDADGPVGPGCRKTRPIQEIGRCDGRADEVCLL